MSQYNIEHTCGHKQTYNLIGSNVNGEREGKKEFLETVACTKCQREIRTEALKSRFFDLPEITQGTEKQIAWAMSIRLEAAYKLEEMVNFINEHILPGDPELAEIGYEIVRDTLNNTNFQFWIDQRGELFDQNWMNRKVQECMADA